MSKTSLYRAFIRPVAGEGFLCMDDRQNEDRLNLPELSDLIEHVLGAFHGVLQNADFRGDVIVIE